MNQQSFICTTCGTGYEVSNEPPAQCRTCQDERQYVGFRGQVWTTLNELNRGYKNIFEKVSPDLYAIYTNPAFAIGQRVHLLLTPHGNILWDCIANLDATTIEIVNRFGGIKMIAISHPHYYTTMAEWSKAFNDAPVYLHQKDEEWIPRKDFNLVQWAGETKEILPGVTLINSAGHFAGGTVLHYKSLLLVGDIIQVCPDMKSVSFMYSYPNMIPLPKKDILHIRSSLEPFQFDTMVGAFGLSIRSGAIKALQYSLERYLKIYE